MKVFSSLASTEEFCTGAMKMRRQYNIVEKFLWIIWILIEPLEELSAWTNRHQGLIGLIGVILTTIFGIVAIFGFKVTPSELLEYFDNPIYSGLLALFIWKFIVESTWSYLTKSKKSRLYSKIKSQNKTIQLLEAENLRMFKLISDLKSQQQAERAKDLKEIKNKPVKPQLTTKKQRINLQSKTDEEICRKGMQIASGIKELIQRAALTNQEKHAIKLALDLKESGKRGVAISLPEAMMPPTQPSQFDIAEAYEESTERKEREAIQEYRSKFQDRAQSYKSEILKRPSFNTDEVEDINYIICRSIDELKVIGQNLGQLSRTLERE